MSILFQNKQFVHICHEKYINNIYNNENEVLKFTINNLIFNVNSKFCRKHDTEVQPRSRKRKRSGHLIISNRILDKIEIDFNEFIKVSKLSKTNTHTNYSETNESSLEFLKHVQKQEALPILKGGNTSDVSIVVQIQNSEYLIPPRCTFYNNDIRGINKFFDMNQSFDLVVIDPPWWNKSVRRIKRTSKISGYNMMTNNEICDIPIEKLINHNSIVIIWCTNAESNQNDVTNLFIPKWNLKLVALIPWLKITKSAEPVTNFQINGCKQPYEKVYIACHERREGVNMENIENLKLIVSVPSLIHSHKPCLLGM